MGFSSDEFLRMREMGSYNFDYYEPVLTDYHYRFSIEAESKDEAIEKANEIIENAEWEKCDYDIDINHYATDDARDRELYYDNELIKKYE